MPLAAYCYLRVVGRGSYGEVTLVRHRRDGRQVGRVGAHQGAGNAQGFAQGSVQTLDPGVVCKGLTPMALLWAYVPVHFL